MFPNRTILFIGGITKSISKCTSLPYLFTIADIVTYFSKYCDILDCVLTIDNTKSKIILKIRPGLLFYHRSE